MKSIFRYLCNFIKVDQNKLRTLYVIELYKDAINILKRIEDTKVDNVIKELKKYVRDFEQKSNE